MLRKPINLDIGMHFAQLIRDCNIALRVTETDRGGDVERTLAAGFSAYPASRRRRRLDEVPKEQVDLDRIAQVWCVS